MCYKVLLEKEEGLVSPFYEMKYKDGTNKPEFVYETEASQRARERFSDGVRCEGKFRYSVEDGYLHSYKTLRAAILLARTIKFSRITLNPVIAKCIIPKGTLYFSGNASDCASQSLRLTEIVDTCSIKYRIAKLLSYKLSI